jgi:hypothetical protein
MFSHNFKVYIYTKYLKGGGGGEEDIYGSHIPSSFFHSVI